MLRKVLKYFLVLLAVGFVVLLIGRYIYLQNQEETALQVEKIHNTKLQPLDVMGTNLPSDPGEAADDTVEGIDVNKNGIRDDVELAVFREYPNSAQTRAVLLQYALVLQKKLAQPFMNEDVATAIAIEDSKAYACIGSIVPASNNDLQIINDYRDFLESKQFNTIDRNQARDNYYQKVRSFELQSGCDIDLSLFTN